MMVQDTSFEAWKQVKETLSTRQQVVYEKIKKFPNHTSGEYACMLKCHTNSSAPRITELKKLNKIFRVERRECAVTKGTSWTWRVV